MNKIKVLDCTLRDGGYCNQWKFGYRNIKRIMAGLAESGVDIIECGFLTDQIAYEPDRTKFCQLGQIGDLIPQRRGQSMFVAMANSGEFDMSKLPHCREAAIDGIRIAFHKQQREQALAECRLAADLGYKTFVQAMVTLSYSDEEFLDLIHHANQIHPYAFYIVDSFGMMKKKDLRRLFFMVEHNLDRDILIGFHSHNNMQLAYSNAQSLVEIMTHRELIIDSSIMGMGRGAGNLNTELFLEYINDVLGFTYDVKPLLRLMDEVVHSFYEKNYWGYSLPNYLSAAYNTHPNYASYLADKNSLAIEDMDEIFNRMDRDKRLEFDEGYIEKLYMEYMGMHPARPGSPVKLSQQLYRKRILVIAPGKSAEQEKEKIIRFARGGDIVSISINHEYPYVDTDYIFLSNLRRKRELRPENSHRLIVTSNIQGIQAKAVLSYSDLLNHRPFVNDNAGMMLIKFLVQLGAEEIILAGMDGYSHAMSDNYAQPSMQMMTHQHILDGMNEEMTKLIKEYSQKVKITFLTEKRYIGD